MAITLPSGFKITSTDPIDSRITVADQSARLSFSEVNVYNGLVVFQRDTNELYVLNDTGSWNVSSGWSLVGSGGSGSAIPNWTLGANGTSDYTFTGPGLTGAENDPTIYLTRGQEYEFTNNMGAHPFRIQSTPNGSTGTQYNDGITNNDVSNGVLSWDVQFDSPDVLYYQCTSHADMGGEIIILNTGSSASVPSGTVSSSAQITNLGFINETITSSMSVATASYFGDGIITASSISNTITFTKGDGTTFPISISTGSVEEASRAQSIQIDCRTSEAVSKGDPLYITGFDPGQNRPEVGKADASNSNKMPVVGLALEDAAINTNTRFVQAGQLTNLNTDIDGASVNATLYVAVGGGFTTTRPTGSSNLVQNIGKIERVQQNNGEIIVSAILRTNDVPNIQPGYVWVGNNDGVATPTPTSSFSGAVPAGTVSSSAQITNLGFINETITSSMSVASASIAETASFIEFDGNRPISNPSQPSGIYGQNYGTNDLVGFLNEAYFSNTDPIIDSLVFDVNEYSAQGTTVGTIQYTDPLDTVTFQTQSSYTDDDFRVASNGVITVQTTLLTESLENNNSQGYGAVLFPVRGTDSSGTTVDKDLYIRIAGNTAPVFRENGIGGNVLSGTFTASLSESSAAGAKANGTVYVTDANGDALTLQSGSLPTAFTNAFDLTILSDRFTLTQTTSSLDYDTNPTFDFVLTASDEHYQSGQDPSAITYLDYHIRVLDNITPTINNQQFNINENVNIDNGEGLLSGEYRNVGQLTADGPESGDIITYSNFSLQSLSIGGVNVPLGTYTGGGQSDPTENAFTMTSAGYITRINGVFVNSDLIDSYVYQVTVQDQYDPGTDTALITIDIDDDIAPGINNNWGGGPYIIESALINRDLYADPSGYTGTINQFESTYNEQNESVSYTVSSPGNVLRIEPAINFMDPRKKLVTNQDISGSYVDGDTIDFSITASNTFGTQNKQAYTVQVTENVAPSVSYSDVAGGLTGSQAPGTKVGTITVTDSQGENIDSLTLSGADAGSFALGTAPAAGSTRAWDLNVGASNLASGTYSLNGVGTDAYGKSTTQPISITIDAATATSKGYAYTMDLNAIINNALGITSTNSSTPPVPTISTAFGLLNNIVNEDNLGDATITYDYGGTDNYSIVRGYEGQGETPDDFIKDNDLANVSVNTQHRLLLFVPKSGNMTDLPTSFYFGDPNSSNTTPNQYCLFINSSNTFNNGASSGGAGSNIKGAKVFDITLNTAVDGYTDWYLIITEDRYLSSTGNIYSRMIPADASEGGLPS